MGGCHPRGDNTWQLLWLTVGRPWLALGGPVLFIVAQMGVENVPLTFWGSISGTVGSFQS